MIVGVPKVLTATPAPEIGMPAFNPQPVPVGAAVTVNVPLLPDPGAIDPVSVEQPVLSQCGLDVPTHETTLAVALLEKKSKALAPVHTSTQSPGRCDCGTTNIWVLAPPLPIHVPPVFG